MKKELTEKMTAAAENLEFERAKEYRDQITNIEIVMEKQTMTMNDFTDRDIFGYAVDKGWMCVQVFFVTTREINRTRCFDFPTISRSRRRTVDIHRSILYEIEHIKPKEILLPPGIDSEIVRQLLRCKCIYSTTRKKERPCRSWR